MPPSRASIPASDLNQDRWFMENVHLHDGQLKSYLHGAFPRVRDVDDIVQESYLRLWRRQTERPIASIKAFLFTIARRLAIDTSRQQRRSPIEYIGVPAQMDVRDESENVISNVCRAERIRLLTDAIDALPKRCREVIVLRKIQLLSTHEVAQRLGITEHAVENYFTRGTARIRKHLTLRGVKQTLGCEP